MRSVTPIKNIQIRLAHTRDLPQVMALLRQVVPLMRAAGNLQWDDHYPNEEIFLSDIAQGQLWVAEQDRAVAGVAAITTHQAPEYAQAGCDLSEQAIVVHRLAVDPAYRGAGIAEALMRQAEAVARQRGIAVMRVDTNTKNVATQRLFPKLGYTLAGEISLNFREGLRFFCYEKRLEAVPQRSHLAAIALGSNLASQWGDREANLREAIARLQQLGQVIAVSSFLDTAPVGYADQPNFLNGALLLQTALEPQELLRKLLAIEQAMGRDRTSVQPKGPRIIDLDLLLVDDLILVTDDLTVPHPALADRLFVLQPLAQIAPTLVDPLSGLTVSELLTRLNSLRKEA